MDCHLKGAVCVGLALGLLSATNASAAELPARCRAEITFDANDRDREEAEFMRSKIEAANLPAKLTVLTPFAAAFAPHPAKMAWSITQSEWDAWRTAVEQLEPGLRGVLRKHARDIRAHYALGNDRPRARYWACVQASF